MASCFASSIASFDFLSCRIFKITGAAIAAPIANQGFKSAAFNIAIVLWPPAAARAAIEVNIDPKDLAAPLKSPVINREKPVNALRSVYTDTRAEDVPLAISTRVLVYCLVSDLACRIALFCFAIASARLSTSTAAALADSGAASSSGIAVPIKLRCSTSLFCEVITLFSAVFVPCDLKCARAMYTASAYFSSKARSCLLSSIASFANRFCSA